MTTSNAAPDHNSSAIGYAAQIVTAYVAHNSVPAAELGALLAATHAALVRVSTGQAPAAPRPELVPPVSIKRSIHNDYIVCLEDGKRFKSLRRHLTTFDLTPDQYRAKWGLPHDYPMVAPNYAKVRSELAKSAGLGRKAPKPAPPARGRKKAAA